MEVIFAYMMLCIFCAWLGKAAGGNSGRWFLAALIISPFLAMVAILVMAIVKPKQVIIVRR